MRRILIAIGILILLLAGVWFGVGAALPGEYEVSRSIGIAAPPEAVYALVGHLDRWPEWTSWNTEQYPDLVYVYPGPREGVGAVQTWTMDSMTGRLEVTSAEAARGISYDLSFDGGAFESDGIISFEPAADGTTVTWMDRGTLDSTRERWVGLFLDAMMGAQFEEGLGRLKSKVEGE